MTEPALILNAKLLPPAPGPFHLPRPRLQERLAAGLKGRTTVVLGGPGYGKTSLVAKFLEEQGGDSVWYWVDASDKDPWMLFRYLVEGIRRHVPDFGNRSSGLWQSLRSRPEEVEQLADVFIRDAEEQLGGRIVLVLDGIESLEGNPLCLRAVRRLLSYLPGTLHLLLIGRGLPEVGVKALVAQGAATVLQAEDLRLRLEETRALLGKIFTLPVDEDTVVKVHARTRGWVTALQLLRQAARLEQGMETFDEVFEKTEPEIFDYFSEQVLAAEPAQVREFLLSTAVLAVIDPELVADALEGMDVRGVLARLLQRNLFLSPLQSREELYAYDPLFRDFLVKKIRGERGAHELLRLHHAYGAAFARREDYAQALHHLVAAGDVPGAADLLAVRGRALLRAGMVEKVREAALVAAKRAVLPAFMGDVLGEACRLTGDHAAAIRHFERALAESEGEVPALRDEARARTLQGLAYSLLQIGEMTGAADAAQQALGEAGRDNPALAARILNTLSIVRYREGRHQEAVAGWQDALVRARQGGDEHLTLMIAHNLGLPHAVMGDFRRASECFRLLARPENPRLGPEEGAAYLNLARIATLRGEYEEATSLLEDAWEISQKWKLQSLAADVLEAQATLLRETGQLEAAAGKYSMARALFTSLGLHDLLDSLAEEEATLMARRGDIEQADRVASEILERMRAGGNEERIASTLLALGEMRARWGEAALAVEPLAEAASLFESLGYVYQQCMANLWLALAQGRRGSAGEAAEAGRKALALASKLDYGAAVRRVAELDDRLRATLAALPQAAGLLLEAVREQGRPRSAIEAGAVRADRPDLTVRLLGPAEVYRDADNKIPPSAWKLRKALKVFCYLAASRNHRTTKDRLVDVVWGDARPLVIEKNFHPTISFLRRALNYGRHVPKNFILCEAGAYMLNPTYRYDIDVEAFEETIRSARRRASSGDGEGALSSYESALALYRGPFLDEEDDDWIEAPRSHYEEIFHAALAEAGELHLRKGDPEAGLARLTELVERNPLDEEASVRLMAALGSRGRRGAVEKEFRRLEGALQEAFSVPPGVEARRAYQRALAGK